MNKIEKYADIETIKENPEVFLELLSITEVSPDLDEEHVIRIFKKWNEVRERNILINSDKIEEINSAYLNLIKFIKQTDFARFLLLIPFFKLGYKDFKGLINLFEDAKERDCFKDLVLYWGHKCNNIELKYAILAGGFHEPEVYEELKQKSLKLSYKK